MLSGSLIHRKHSTTQELLQSFQRTLRCAMHSQVEVRFATEQRTAWRRSSCVMNCLTKLCLAGFCRRANRSQRALSTHFWRMAHTMPQITRHIVTTAAAAEHGCGLITALSLDYQLFLPPLLQSMVLVGSLREAWIENSLRVNGSCRAKCICTLPIHLVHCHDYTRSKTCGAMGAWATAGSRAHRQCSGATKLRSVYHALLACG